MCMALVDLRKWNAFVCCFFMNSPGRQFKQFALLMEELLVFPRSTTKILSRTRQKRRNRESASGDNRIYFYGEFYYGRIWDLDFFGSHALMSIGDEKKIY